ncbi:ABC transporter ATP-binding protein [Mycoplasmatota bacterium WC30]
MIKLTNISKFYSSNNVIALGLRKVNLELHRNEFVAIVGESGSGKTTLLNVISGIDSYEDGEMYINGHETSYFSVADMENYRKKYVAFVFQSYNLIDSYTVLQNVEAPLILSGYPQDKIKDRAHEIIRKVGLEKHMNHKATKLSGGQKQRVVIARALAKDCPIIAADEPTGNLDSKSARQIIELLSEISKEKLVIIVTHDFSQVEEFATRKIRIFDGEIVEDLKIKKVKKLDLPNIPDEDHQIRFVDYLKISLRNLLAVPKKTVLMVVIFTFFSFFIAMSYGAYQLAMNDSGYSFNSHFVNTSPNRVIIRKDDKSAFSDEDLAEIEGYSIVDHIVTFDYVLDINLTISSETANNYTYLNGLLLPMEVIEADDLDYGILPKADSEIVIAVNNYELNNYEDYLDKIFVQGYNYYYDEIGPANLDMKTYKVVGMIDVDKLSITSESYDNTFFLVTEGQLNSFKKSFYFNYADTHTFMGTVSLEGFDYPFVESFYSPVFEIDNTIPDNEIRTSSGKYYGDCTEDICYISGTLTMEDYYVVDNEYDNIVMAFDKDLEDGIYYVNQDTYEKIYYNDIYQISVLTKTDIGVAGFVKDIQKITTSPLNFKYKANYPFDSEASNDFEALILLATSIGLIGLIIITLIGSTLITYVIFRAIINTKLHDYAIFRTIGANQNTIKGFIYLENLYVVLVSYIIYLAVSISIPLRVATNTALYPLKVFGVWNYIVFFFLLVIMSLVISRKYCNRIFRQSVQKTLKSDLG